MEIKTVYAILAIHATGEEFVVHGDGNKPMITYDENSVDMLRDRLRGIARQEGKTIVVRKFIAIESDEPI